MNRSTQEQLIDLVRKNVPAVVGCKIASDIAKRRLAEAKVELIAAETALEARVGLEEAAFQCLMELVILSKIRIEEHTTTEHIIRNVLLARPGNEELRFYESVVQDIKAVLFVKDKDEANEG